MLSRRALIGRLAAGAAGAAVASVADVRLARAALPRTDWHALTDSGQEESPSAPPSETIGAADASAVVPPTKADNGVIDADAVTTATPAWELIRPLALGSGVAYGWRVAGLSGVADGSCVLTLENERGRRHRVHICRNDGRPHGFVYTRRLDLIVMNGGQGDLPTEEGFAQAVAEVAHVLAANERRRGHEQVIAQLMPQAERLRMFSGPVDRRLR